MDLAHKEFLEKKSKEELIAIILDLEETERRIQHIRNIEETRFREREETIKTLLKVIKYQNGGID